MALSAATQDLTPGRTLGTGLSGIDLSENDLRGWNFAGHDLAHADLVRSDLSTRLEVLPDQPRLTVATFNGANVSNAIPNGASFLNADLSGADLTGTSLTVADFTVADLRGAAGFSPGETTVSRNTICSIGASRST